VSVHNGKTFYIDDATWGGINSKTGKLNPTSQRWVDVSDGYISVGGRDVARAEMQGVKQKGGKVKYHNAAGERGYVEKMLKKEAGKFGKLSQIDLYGENYGLSLKGRIHIMFAQAKNAATIWLKNFRAQKPFKPKKPSKSKAFQRGFKYGANTKGAINPYLKGSTKAGAVVGKAAAKAAKGGAVALKGAKLGAKVAMKGLAVGVAVHAISECMEDLATLQNNAKKGIPIDPDLWDSVRFCATDALLGRGATKAIVDTCISQGKEDERTGGARFVDCMKGAGNIAKAIVVDLPAATYAGTKKCLKEKNCMEKLGKVILFTYFF
jgi:hypothetical protein